MMRFIKHLLLFIKNNVVQLKRQWLSLPLLFLFPLFLIGIISTLVVSLFIPATDDPLQLGIVDLDESEETTTIVNLLTNNSELGTLIEIDSMTEREAKDRIERDELSGFITFPERFTFSLYEGTPVTLPVTGNPNQTVPSYLIKELTDSVARLISAAQANILTINHYAKEIGIDETERHDMLFDHFTSFLFDTLGKDKVIDLETVTNEATATPLLYYTLASWFIVSMIWLLIFYNFLYKEEAIRMKQRMKLYDVKEIQEVFARIIVVLTLTLLLAFALLITLNNILEFGLILEDYMRLFILLLLHSITFLLCLALIELILASPKVRLLIQCFTTLLFILLSGAIIPAIYFPIQIQTFAPYVFSNQAFYWITEIILNERFFADYNLLLLMSATGFFAVLGISLWKEHGQK